MARHKIAAIAIVALCALAFGAIMADVLLNLFMGCEPGQVPSTCFWPYK